MPEPNWELEADTNQSVSPMITSKITPETAARDDVQLPARRTLATGATTQILRTFPSLVTSAHCKVLLISSAIGSSQS